MTRVHDSTAASRDTRSRPDVLRAEGLVKMYGGIRAVDGVSLGLARGECLALAGENGAGKSTVIGMLGGARSPDAGLVFVDGRPTRFAVPQDAMNAGIGVVYQEPHVVDELDVVGNVFLNNEPRRRYLRVVDRHAMLARFQELVVTTGIELDPCRLVGDLSVAQRQLVQLLRVLAAGARVIILDEPTAALSPADRERLFRLIGSLRTAADPRSFILVSHFLEELERVCDRAVVLRNGKIAGEIEGPPAPAAVARLMTDGRGLAERRRARRVVSNDVALRVRQLVVDESPPIDLDVRVGEIVGLAGLVGSGRTELMEAIALGRRRTSGQVEVDGAQVGDAAEAVRAGLVMLTEDRRRGLVADWPLWRNVTLASLGDTARGLLTDRQAERARVAPLMKRLRVAAPNADVAAETLSGGNQQKIIFAKLVAARCKVGVLDEPTHGIDVGAKAEILTIIEELAAEGAGFLICAAEFEDLLAVCDRIVTVHRGGIVAAHLADDSSVTVEGLLMEAATGPSVDKEATAA